MLPLLEPLASLGNLALGDFAALRHIEAMHRVSNLLSIPRFEFVLIGDWAHDTAGVAHRNHI